MKFFKRIKKKESCCSINIEEVKEEKEEKKNKPSCCDIKIEEVSEEVLPKSEPENLGCSN